MGMDQVEAPAQGLMGEGVPVDVVVRAVDPLAKPTLLLQAAFREDGGPGPPIRLRAGVGVRGAGEEVGGSLELGPQAAGAEVRVPLELGADRAGHVTLTVQLLYLPGEVCPFRDIYKKFRTRVRVVKTEGRAM